MSRKMKITIIATVIMIISITVLCGFNSVVFGNTEAEEFKTLYSLDKRELIVPQSEVDTYLNLGWFIAPVMKVYSVDGLELIIYCSEFNDYHAVGWFSEPVKLMYNSTGNKEVVVKRFVDYYKTIGYREVLPINDEDILLLAKVIYAEATSNPELKKMDMQYVGAVVMNRVRHPRFPNSVKEVIYAKGQYACLGSPRFNQYPPQECLEIAKQLLQGETFGVPSNVVFQAQFQQGSGVWKRVGVHYYCYI